MKRELFVLLIFGLGLGCGIAVGSRLSNDILREQQRKHVTDTQALFARVNDLAEVVRLTQLKSAAKQILDATDTVNTGIGEMKGFHSLDGDPLDQPKGAGPTAPTEILPGGGVLDLPDPYTPPGTGVPGAGKVR